MRASQSADGLTVRLIAGTRVVLVAMSLSAEKRPGCLGFAIERTDLSPQADGQKFWLNNRLGFSDSPDAESSSDQTPIQAFRYLDLNVQPGGDYLYRVVAQYGRPKDLAPGAAVELKITTETPANPATAVYFNRGAGSSSAYTRRFGTSAPDALPPEQAQAARTWLSNGLEEAILDFLAQAKDSTFGLHVAMYEFKKPELVNALQQAHQRGVDVRVVYDTGAINRDQNAQAANSAGLAQLCRPRSKAGRFMHNKFVILLQQGRPQAILAGSTNWTDTALYGQMNNVQIFADPALAERYEGYFQILYQDPPLASAKTSVEALTPDSNELASAPGVWPVFSPRKDTAILNRYAAICQSARTLFVCNSFDMAPQINDAIVAKDQPGDLLFSITGRQQAGGRALTSASLGGEAVTAAAPTYSRNGNFLNTSLLIADPLGPDPVVVTGSAHLSSGSTVSNDENSLIIRGSPALADIYLTEFLRVFDNLRLNARAAESGPDRPLALAADDSWSAPFYEVLSRKAVERQYFAGETLALPAALPVAALEQFRLGDTARELIQGVRSLGQDLRRGLPLSGGFLFYALALDTGLASKDATLAWFQQKAQAAPGFAAESQAFQARAGLAHFTPAEAVKAQSQRASTITPGFQQVFQRALTLAGEAASHPVEARHILTAVLSRGIQPETDGVAEQTTRSGLDLTALRRELYAYLYRNDLLLADLSEVWLLGTSKEIDAPSAYNADAPAGTDLLDLHREVNAFARLMAARDVQPPLSIGLFGEWGAGKTFFMREMQRKVDGLSRAARESGLMQRNFPYFKRIIQIEFNAWHYIEGNLWASLVQHIFDQLKGFQGEDGDELRNYLLDVLRNKTEAEAAATRAVEAAKAREKQLAKELKKAQSDLDATVNDLADNYAKRDLRDYFFEPLANQFNELIGELGLTPLQKGGQDMVSALREARTVVEHSSALWAPLSRAGDRRRRWFVLILSLLAVPLAAFLFGWIPTLLGRELLGQITALAGGVGALLVSGANWLRSQAGWASEHLKKIEQVQKEYDQNVADRLAEYTRNITELEEERTQLRAQLAQAAGRQAEARKQLEEAQAGLAHVQVTSLANFIRDRAESSDYRKYLGLPALIRKDFKTLSEMMDAQNYYLSAPDPQDELNPRYPGSKYQTLEEETRDERLRVSRIILYIDDLDRCPPSKVVEVLQAVHLLLAFPLFVVVVGVDSRWITRSLIAEHRDLLKDDQIIERRDPAQPPLRIAGAMEKEEIFGSATPRDYLEKIFQIPYWLKPMDVEATRNMLNGLLGKVQPQGSTQPADQKAPQPGTSAGGVSGAGVEISAAGPAGPAGSPPAPSSSAELAAGPASPQAAQSAAEPSENADPAEGLRITPAELSFMGELAPLLGQSPRSLKRFINVYRLVKARLTQNELIVFTAEGGILPDYKAVLFLLAIDVGMPEIAQRIYPYCQPGGQPDLLTVIRVLDRDPKTRAHPDWDRFKEWLVVAEEPDLEEAASQELKRKVPSQLRLPTDLLPFKTWGPVVSRYSFQFANCE